MWQTHIDCCQGHRSSFEFQFGVAGKAIREGSVCGGGCVRQRRASQQQVQSLIDKSHLSQSERHSFHYSLTVLLYKRTKYWFKPRYTASRVQDGHRKRNNLKALHQTAPEFHSNTQITSFKQPEIELLFYFEIYWPSNVTHPPNLFSKLVSSQTSVFTVWGNTWRVRWTSPLQKSNNNNSNKKGYGLPEAGKTLLQHSFEQADKEGRKEQRRIFCSAQEQSCNASWWVTKISISVGVAFMRRACVCLSRSARVYLLSICAWMRGRMGKREKAKMKKKMKNELV